MFTITVNNKKAAADHGETILTVLKREKIDIPTLCHFEGLTPTGSCRICIVELADSGRLIPGCSSEVFENMKILTHSPAVVEARKTILSLLLANHPDDCLYCVKQGNCELSRLAQTYGIRERLTTHTHKHTRLDISGTSIVRDNSKCILCGKCIRVCDEIQTVSAIDFVSRGHTTEVACVFKNNINISSCINCGQCINVCPTGALYEKSHIEQTIDALKDPDKTVVIQCAPSISVTIAEEFGIKPGKDVAGQLNSSLRKLGFDYIFDTTFTADLTIMEEATELITRITENKPLPMMTSCSPGWIKFVEQFYPEFIPNISTCKSPQAMLGALIKTHFAKTKNLKPENIYSVSIMPCTAKKFEAARPELMTDHNSDIDAVLTTRELASLLKQYSINPMNETPSAPDLPFGTITSAGKLFGVSGGVMEAALRTAYFLLTGEEKTDPVVKETREQNGIKYGTIRIKDIDLTYIAASGLKNARKILEDMKQGKIKAHFIEIMTCPGGCINGGGQPINLNTNAVKERMKALYTLDRDAKIRVSHENPAIKTLYAEFLGKPCGEKSHNLLHTHYISREDVL